MKTRFARIFVSLLVFSIAFQFLAVPALGEDDSAQKQPNILFQEIPDEESILFHPGEMKAVEQPHRIMPDELLSAYDGYLYQSLPLPEGMLPELAERYHRGEERQAQPQSDPPSAEVIALTKQQVQSFDCAAVTDVPPLECEALVALYNSTNGAGWTDNTNWLNSTTVGNWFGVISNDGHVIDLDINENNLSGSIPPELGNLANLEGLDLLFNQLTGSIPPELGNLANLEGLDLRVNRLTGSIPPQLGNLSDLLELRLYSNQLTDSIPPELGNLANLEILDLGLNLFTGSIPPELINLANLGILDLGSNQLTGSIPPQLGNLSDLLDLRLDSNQLTGSIPPELGNLVNLDSLHLSFNQLTGSIPPELGNLANLWSLTLDSNQLTGSIPPQLGNLANLQNLFLDANQLTGSIPPELGNLSNLQNLSLYSNQLTGSIPPELGNLTSLYGLDLSDNMFIGNVPASFTNLVNLCEPGYQDSPCYDYWKLDLGYNRLNVPAPEPPAGFLAIKDPDWHLTQAVEKDVTGEIGGTILSNDGNTEIEIPIGAFDGSITFLFAPQPDPGHITGTMVSTGNNFELTAAQAGTPVTTFAKPLTLTLHYTDEQVVQIPENTLALYYWDIDLMEWIDAVTTCSGGEYTRNLAENWLSLPLCHLSEFALMGGPLRTYLPLINK